jgi:hypothetical protein
MSASEHLGTYAEGWTKGDAELILKVATDNFTFDDPNAGVIPKNEFAGYLKGMKETVSSLREGTLSSGRNVAGAIYGIIRGRDRGKRRCINGMVLVGCSRHPD